jgi:FixJ family two-component response regulator
MILSTSKVDPQQEDSSEVIFIVDDDSALRFGLDTLFRSVGFAVEAFSSAADCLSAMTENSSGCLVVDVRMPGLSGMDLQTRLSEANITLPIIFMSGHGDIPMAVSAMRAGAIDFLEKPFRHHEMLNAVNRALEVDRRQRSNKREVADAQALYDRLTPRERAVLNLVVQGRLNKQVAAELGLSEFTIKQHRGRLMRKMSVGSLAELVTMAARLKLSNPTI